MPEEPEKDLVQSALSAWEVAPLGESKKSGIRAMRSKNFLILSESEPEGGYAEHSFHHIVAFPKPEHFPIFRDATKFVKGGGPGMQNPGAVGTIGLFLQSKHVELNFVQAHFKSSEVEPRSPINRALSSKYGGWRVRALEEAIRFAHAREQSLHIPKKEESVKRLLKNKGKILSRVKKAVTREPSPFVKDLRQACVNLGVSIESNSKELIIRPRMRE